MYALKKNEVKRIAETNISHCAKHTNLHYFNCCQPDNTGLGLSFFILNFACLEYHDDANLMLGSGFYNGAKVFKVLSLV